MRPALAVLAGLLVAGPVVAAQPIRLQVIPFRAGWRSNQIPVHDFKGTLLPPPAFMPTLPPVGSMRQKRRPNSGRDYDWLMD